MFRIALARWSEDNFNKMIHIMKHATAEGTYCLNSTLAALDPLTKGKHTKSSKRIQIKSHKKV